MPVPDGFVATPDILADWLAAEVLLEAPEEGDRILYPGAGTGQIAAAVHRRCSVRALPAPDGVAVERDPGRARDCRKRLVGPEADANHGQPPMSSWSCRLHEPYNSSAEHADVASNMTVLQRDFLRSPPTGPFEYIVANPPYLAYKDIPEADREAYGDQFTAASGQFDLYIPFIEQMLELLAPDGLLAFLAPLRYLQLPMARPLRLRLRQYRVATPMLVPEVAFPDHTITTVLTLVGGRQASCLHDLQPPSEERLRLTYISGNLYYYVMRGLGLDEDAAHDSFSTYTDKQRFHESRIRRTDRADRVALDRRATERNEHQTSVAEWTG